LTQEIESAASKLEKQNERTVTLTVSGKRRSRAEILDAVSDAASGHAQELYTNVTNVSTRIGEENQATRAQVEDLVDVIQEVMKQEIHGLQQGLRQLEKEIDRKVDELKDLVIKINTTRKGLDRQFFRDKGNSVNVILMSLYELFKSLQVFGITTSVVPGGAACGNAWGLSWFMGYRTPRALQHRFIQRVQDQSISEGI